jgi:LysM repeat protein
MYYLRKRIVRAAALTAATALGIATLVTVSAQEAERAAGTPPSSLLTAAVGQPETQPVLNPRHPDTYVVQPGDTLWDIAAMFLRDPWYWPEIWQINPQVANPHLIYPGDVLSLAYLDDGRPVVFREGSGNTVRLSPRIRIEQLEDPIPTIPYEVLRSFLSNPTVISDEELETLPYIVAPREALMGSAGNDVYYRGQNGNVGDVLSVFHVGDPIVDPDDDAILGYEGIYVGEGFVRCDGDPSTLRMTNSTREALVGDLLMVNDESYPANFLPRPPNGDIDGRIVSVIDGISLIGQYQVIVVNRGSRDGIEPGHVLRVYKAGEEIDDLIGRERGRGSEKVLLPDELAGTTMVFRTYDRMSYALVMEATSDIQVLDFVRNP